MRSKDGWKEGARVNFRKTIRIGTEGRLSIPKEIRKELTIKDEDVLEVFVDGEFVVLKKHIPERKLIDDLDVFKSKFELESQDLKYHDVKEIEKRINEIKMILEKKV